MASNGDVNYEFGLEMEELEKRTSKEFLTTKVLLKADSPEYLQLEDGDKKGFKTFSKSWNNFRKYPLSN